MRYLTLGEVLELHHRIILRWGGASRIRDLGALESAVAQPRMTIGGSDLYIDIAAKAAALCLSLIRIIRLWTGTSGWGMLPWRHSCCSMAARSRLRPTSKSRSCCQWHLAISLATTLLCGSGSTLSSDERRGIGLFVQTLKEGRRI